MFPSNDNTHDYHMDSGSLAMLVTNSFPSPGPPSSSFTNSNKDAQTTYLYIHEQPTLQIIQLIEVPPPPRRSHHYHSTASSSSIDSSCNSSDHVLEGNESRCSSYCSSEGILGAVQKLAYDDTYKMRLHRVLAWIDGFEREIAVECVDEEPSVTLTGVSSYLYYR